MKRFRKILFVSQGVPGDAEAFERTLALAGRNGAALRAVRCVEGPTSEEVLHSPPRAELQQALEAHQRDLDELIARPRRTGLPVGAKLLFGDPAAEIIRQVLAERHDLVIKPAEEHHGATDALFGNADMELMRRCPCPVWLLRNGRPTRLARILAAVDPDHPEEPGRRLNQLILELASSLAALEGAELHVTHAWAMPGESLLRGPFTPEGRDEIDDRLGEEEGRRAELLAALVRGLDAGAKPPKAHLIRGEAREVIPALARDLASDLIVLGTVCRTGLPGLLMGNTAEAVLRQVGCSVLTVKPEGFSPPEAEPS